ncbi:MAG TPA: thiamine pyrophosphate-binding protein [Acidobacteriota bacterium]|nr:thiamine pyrophosphate-binding protein [Acidobacteriota bacterium]
MADDSQDRGAGQHPAGGAPSAAYLVDRLVALGVTDVVGIPDNDTAQVFERLHDHPTIRLLRVAREGEAFAIAAGLWVGGREPVVIIQNTGLLESGDSLRGTAGRMGVPLLCLIGYRGYAKMLAAKLDSPPESLDAATLTRADVDSVALLTEPTLTAWGVPYWGHDSDIDTDEAVPTAFEAAQQQSQPTAVLLTRGFA